jgi:thiosulfate/3-mercaptopyruvate sulfurtransferase
VSALVDADSLGRLVGTPAAPTLLDVRWTIGGPPGMDQYRRGHVPGARFVDLDRDLAGPPGPGGRHPLPDPGVFQAAMRRCGVRSGWPVVVYDAATSTAAARCWWLLRHWGHEDVHVLDGGCTAWIEAGLPLAHDDPVSEPGDFTARPGRMPTLDAAEAMTLARRGVLLDSRAAERYRGEVEPVDAVAGHIPGARSLPTAGNVGPSGRFLDAEALRDRFAAIGAVEGVKIGAYCGSGVTAAHQVLALELAGLRGALYIGSWSEWIADPSRPVVTGAEPWGGAAPAPGAPSAGT